MNKVLPQELLTERRRQRAILDRTVSRRKRIKQMQETPLEPGDKVWYNGMICEVLDEWGVFYACRECTKLLPNRNSKCCKYPATFKKFGGQYYRPNEIKGEGIFDLLFPDGKTRSINRWWLEKIERITGTTVILSDESGHNGGQSGRQNGGDEDNGDGRRVEYDSGGSGVLPVADQRD